MICIFSRLYTITIVYNQESDKLINILMITGLIVNSVNSRQKPLFGSPPFGPAITHLQSEIAIKNYNQKAAAHLSKVFIAACCGHYDDK